MFAATVAWHLLHRKHRFVSAPARGPLEGLTKARLLTIMHDAAYTRPRWTVSRVCRRCARRCHAWTLAIRCKRAHLRSRSRGRNTWWSLVWSEASPGDTDGMTRSRCRVRHRMGRQAERDNKCDRRNAILYDIAKSSTPARGTLDWTCAKNLFLDELIDEDESSHSPWRCPVALWRSRSFAACRVQLPRFAGRRCHRSQSGALCANLNQGLPSDLQ